MAAQLESEVEGNEFDRWMGGSNRPSRSGGVVEDPVEIEARVGGPRRKAKREPLPRKKKLMLLGGGVGIAALACVAVVLVGKPKPAEVSPDVAAIISKASTVPAIQTERAQINQPATPAAAPTPTPAEAMAALDAAAPLTPPATAPAPAPAVAMPAPTAAPAVAATPAPEVKAPAAVAAAKTPVVTAPATPVAAAPAKDPALVAAEAELARLRRELKAARAAARPPAAPNYTLVAVLNDGAVVRDGAGRERVINVGTRIGK